MSTVRITDHESVRVIALDRPPANALDESLLDDLQTAVDDATRSATVRALVLTGTGAFFSAGFDLRVPRRELDDARRMRELYRDAHLALLACPKPTVAMVNGHAIAGGLVLALACDYRLGVAGDYRIGLNEVAIGSSFPKVAFEIVRLRLTHAQASELLLGASLYPVDRHAARLGVLDELLPAATFNDTVLRRAARLAAFPREAYAHTKTALVADAVARVRAETPAQADATAAVWMTDESRAARAAQRTKLERA
jgi:enoyl-CoA hydratase